MPGKGTFPVAPRPEPAANPLDRLFPNGVKRLDPAAVAWLMSVLRGAAAGERGRADAATPGGGSELCGDAAAGTGRVAIKRAVEEKAPERRGRPPSGEIPQDLAEFPKG